MHLKTYLKNDRCVNMKHVQLDVQPASPSRISSSQSCGRSSGLLTVTLVRNEWLPVRLSSLVFALLLCFSSPEPLRIKCALTFIDKNVWILAYFSQLLWQSIDLSRCFTCKTQTVTVPAAHMWSFFAGCPNESGSNCITQSLFTHIHI